MAINQSGLSLQSNLKPVPRQWSTKKKHDLDEPAIWSNDTGQ